jgi:group I intron endonuclease
MNKAGIYSITNARDNKVYVGRSVNIEIRWKQHKYLLKCGKNSPILQHAWDKYGESAFVFTVLEYCNPSEIVSKESEWIIKLNACDRRYGYNLNNETGDGSYTQSDETRQLRSKIMKLKASDPAWREANRKRVFKMIEEGRWSTLKTRTDEEVKRWLNTQRTDSIRKLRSDYAKQQGLGKNIAWDEERRKEWSVKFSGEGNPCYGKALPEERKQKISASLKGKPSPKPPGFGNKIAEVRRQYWAKKRAERDSIPCDDKD